MTYSNLKKIIWMILPLFLVILGMGELAKAQQSRKSKRAAQRENPASQGPDVFAVIKLNNPGQLIQNVGQLVERVQPGMGILVNPATVGQMLFKNPTWAGMDVAGNYTLIILNPQKYPQSPFAALIPITDKGSFVNTLSQSLAKGREVRGTYSFKDSASKKDFFLTFTGNTGILTENMNISTLVKSLVEKNSPDLGAIPYVKGGLTASIPVSRIMAAYRPMVDVMKQQMTMEMEKEAKAPQQKPGAVVPSIQTEALKNLLQAEMDIFIAFLEQTNALNLGIDMQPGGLRISKAILPINGSRMASFFAAQAPQKSPLLGAIPQDSAMIMSATLNPTPEVIDMYTDIMKLVTGVAPGTDPKTVERFTEWMKDYVNVFSGDFVFGGLNPPAENVMSYVYKVQDRAKAKQLMETYPDLLTPMMSFYKNMGMTFDIKIVKTQQYKGGDILVYKFNLDYGNLGDPKAQEFFTKFFGEDTLMPIGFIGEYMVVGIGKNAVGQVQKSMDLLSKGTIPPAKHTPSSFGFFEENNLFLYYSLPKLFAWASSFDPKLPKIDIKDSPGIGISGRFVESHLEGELFIPVEEIVTIGDIMKKTGNVPQPQ